MPNVAIRVYKTHTDVRAGQLGHPCEARLLLADELFAYVPGQQGLGRVELCWPGNGQIRNATAARKLIESG